MTRSFLSGPTSTLIRTVHHGTAFATLVGILIAVWLGRDRLEHASGVDFYHIWGISAAHKISAEQLPNPYEHTDETASMLNGYVDASDDDRLQRVNANRRTIDPTGTPWFYSTFSVLPLDFQRAQLIFFLTQHVLFVGGLLLLFRSLKIPWREASFVTVLAVLTFQPFVVDLRVGNVNTFQLFAVTSLGWISFRFAGSTRMGFLLMIGLCLCTAWKPNIAPVTLLMIGGRFARIGARRFVVELVAGGLATAVFVVASASWFRDPNIWIDWYTYLYGANPDKLNSYPVVEGNLSTPLVLSQLMGGAASTWTIALCSGISLTALIALASGARATRRSFAGYVTTILTNTWLVLSLGICVATAISPLMWRHYFTWAVVAPIWVLVSRNRFDGAALLTAGAIALYWEPPGLVNLLGATTLDSLQSLAWIFTWIALLRVIGNPVYKSAPHMSDCAGEAERDRSRINDSHDEGLALKLLT